MATRGRGGRINPNRPPRLITGHVYEQFKPMSEWRQEDGYDTLLVYLPGFQKEYIKVTTEDLNIVRVRGERWIAENKWSRFQEDFRVPENCDMRSIRAKFDGGILTITMPRQTTNEPPPPSATTRLPPKIKEQPSESTKQEAALPTPKKEPKEKKPDRPQTTPLDDHTLPPPPPPATTKTDTQLPPKTKEQPLRRTKQEEDKEDPKEKKPGKPQATPSEGYTLPPQPKPTSSTPTKQEPLPAQEKKEDVEFTVGSIPKHALKQDKTYVDEKPRIGEKTDFDEGKGKEASFEGGTKRDLEGGKQTPNYTGVGWGGFSRSEDRKALVNVGVGVLVIVALGVHVSYTIGLISKGK